MQAIRPLWDELPLQLGRESETKKSEVSPFTDIFERAVDAVKETDREKTEQEYLLATGQLDNPASLLIAATKAQVAVDLLVQLRNKATDAYNELIRMNL